MTTPKRVKVVVHGTAYLCDVDGCQLISVSGALGPSGLIRLPSTAISTLLTNPRLLSLMNNERYAVIDMPGDDIRFAGATAADVFGGGLEIEVLTDFHGALAPFTEHGQREITLWVDGHLHGDLIDALNAACEYHDLDAVVEVFGTDPLPTEAT
jgi:hypothetical protein